MYSPTVNLYFRWLLFVLIFVKTGFGYSQSVTPLDTKLTITVSQKKVIEILHLLTTQSGLSYNYKSNILPTDILLDFEASNEKLSDILYRLLTPYHIEFKYFGGRSILLKKIKSNQSYTLSGYIFDKTNGEKLIGATVFCRYNKIGTLTNDYGFFTLTLPADSLYLEVSYIGYVKFKEMGFNRTNAFKIIQLVPMPDLTEVEIRNESISKSENRPNGYYFNLKAIKEIPSLLGETDILRAIQMVPGVQSSGENIGGFNVRGGGTDQNLVLIDGVPVYNIVHAFGLFSIINPGVVNSIELIKGGFSAKYNGRLSSILDIKLKDGNNQKISGKLNIGMLLSSGTIQGPFLKNKATFLVSFRRTYFDLLTVPYKKISNRITSNTYVGQYYFYDINAKVNYKVGLRNKISLNYFTGVDRGRITEKQTFTDTSEILEKRQYLKDLRWSTMMSSAKWDYNVTDKVFMSTSAGITQYSTSFEDELTWETKPKPEYKISSIEYTQSSGNSDLFLKSCFEINKFKNHKITTGVEFIYHRFNTGTLTYHTREGNQTMDTSIGQKQIFSDEEVLYIEDTWKPNKHITFNLGVSLNSINVKTTRYTLIQPRFNGQYALSKNIYFGGSFTRMQQNMQILPNNSIGLPIDIWLPVTDELKPQNSDQVSLNAAFYIKKHFKLSIEGYYKTMKNLVELKEGAFFVFGGYEWDKSFYIGNGNAKGIEFMLEKHTGKIKGWIGYALSKSVRQFDEINQGNSFPFKYDRRHQLSLFVKFPKTKRNWNISSSWVFSSGSPVTVPTSVYTLNGKTYYELTQRNNIRMSNYHRMDVSFTKTIKYERSTREWNIGIYNIYSHVNPLFISTNFLVNSSSAKLTFYEVGLLPLIPFISYEISF